MKQKVSQLSKKRDLVHYTKNNIKEEVMRDLKLIHPLNIF